VHGGVVQHRPLGAELETCLRHSACGEGASLKNGMSPTEFPPGVSLCLTSNMPWNTSPLQDGRGGQDELQRDNAEGEATHGQSERPMITASAPVSDRALGPVLKIVMMKQCHADSRLSKSKADMFRSCTCCATWDLGSCNARIRALASPVGNHVIRA
jgi:hypothetical protein